MDWNPSMTALQPFDKHIAHTRGVRGGVSLVLASPRPRCQDASRKRCEVTQFVSLRHLKGIRCGVGGLKPACRWRDTISPLPRPISPWSAVACSAMASGEHIRKMAW
eukprot:scaffold2612_cov215-Prasinococcus_capsulatus_cf.AAC.2